MKKTVITVSQSSVSQAELAIEACQGCSAESAISFVNVLHSFRDYDADNVDYLLPILARCPSCSREINESTLVKRRQDAPNGSLS
jgi:hypothetical protein